MEGFVHKEKYFIINAAFYGQPMQVHKYRCNVFSSRNSGHKPGSTVLDELQPFNLVVRDSSK